MLRAGGNAVDAAVAAGFTEGVVEPLHNGIAGYGGCLVIYLAGRRRVVAVDCNSTAPAAASFRDGVRSRIASQPRSPAQSITGWSAASTNGRAPASSMAATTLAAISRLSRRRIWGERTVASRALGNIACLTGTAVNTSIAGELGGVDGKPGQYLFKGVSDPDVLGPLSELD